MKTVLIKIQETKKNSKVRRKYSKNNHEDLYTWEDLGTCSRALEEPAKVHIDQWIIT